MPYNIYRDGSLIASNVLTEEYTDTDLEYGKEYSYQISSLNFYGESELSPAVKVTTLPLTLSLDVNGTVKTGTFAEKTLDEDAYDDLAVKDSNTVYKVYPENGNPDEAAWFLGEQPVDSAKEWDTVVYNRNYFSNSKLLPLSIKPETRKYINSSAGKVVAIKVSEGETVAAKKI